MPTTATCLLPSVMRRPAIMGRGYDGYQVYPPHSCSVLLLNILLLMMLEEKSQHMHSGPGCDSFAPRLMESG